MGVCATSQTAHPQTLMLGPLPRTLPRPVLPTVVPFWWLYPVAQTTACVLIPLFISRCAYQAILPEANPVSPPPGLHHVAPK